MVSTYTTEGDVFRFETPRPWFESDFFQGDARRLFALHPDGERLVAVTAGLESVGTRLTFVFNFFEELERLAPAE